MPTTPNFEIPYPSPSDPVANGAADMQALAERVDVVLPTITGAGTIGARVYRTIAQGIVHATPSVIGFDGERWDTDAIHSLSPDTRLTCKTAGKYLITAHIVWDNNPTGSRACDIRLNGTTQIAGDLKTGIPFAKHSVATIWDLAVNDYVECVVQQQSGGGLNVLASAAESPEFGMIRLGG